MQRLERSSVKETCISSKISCEISTALCRDIVETVLSHSLIWEDTRAFSGAVVLPLLSLSKF